MNWRYLWIAMFGKTNLLGLNMGFWVSMVVIIMIVILMNVFFWSLKPRNSSIDKMNKTQHRSIRIRLKNPLHDSHC